MHQVIIVLENVPVFDVISSHSVKYWQTFSQTFMKIYRIKVVNLSVGVGGVFCAPRYLKYGDPDSHRFSLSQFNTNLYLFNNISVSANNLVSHRLMKMNHTNICNKLSRTK